MTKDKKGNTHNNETQPLTQPNEEHPPSQHTPQLPQLNLPHPAP